MNAPAVQATRPGLEPATDARQHAEQTAEQFEAILVRQLVSSLRETASFGEDGGMFGSGTGSQTYADWFDQHLAEHLGSTKQIGVKQTILDDLERAGQLAREETPAQAAQQASLALRAADRARLTAGAAFQGGIDVTQ